jgi:hypothetical protein
MTKKIVDNSKNEDKESVDKNRIFGKNQGIANKALREPQPTYEKAGSETIEKGKNNTYIIQGRDRPAGLSSGYGSRGATGAGRIDLIAGLASSYKHEDGTYGQPNKRTVVNPNFSQDAARVYISQKADIDRYMGLAPVPGQPEEGRSAVGIKADQIRIHAREDVKIVSGRARFDGAGSDGERLSNGGENKITGKISFIAGNYTEDEKYPSFSVFEPKKVKTPIRKKLQPLVKGENLVMCLNEIVDAINLLSQHVGGNVLALKYLNSAMMSHVHGVAGPVTVPIPSNFPMCLSIGAYITSSDETRRVFTNGLGMIKNNYLSLSTDEVKAALYINSNFVYTT